MLNILSIYWFLSYDSDLLNLDGVNLVVNMNQLMYINPGIDIKIQDTEKSRVTFVLFLVLSYLNRMFILPLVVLDGW